MMLARSIDLPGKTKAQVAQILKEAFSPHPPKAVTAGTDDDSELAKITGTAKSTTKDNFFRMHEFTVLGFTPNAHGGDLVLRNPWAGKDGTTEGTITISLDTYMKNFGGLTVQK